MFSEQDFIWMRQALDLAKRAEEQGEVPVGAVLVLNGEVIGEGFNCPISAKDPTAHAEINALRHGAQRIGNYRICDATLYVTLEPCVMCLGAVTHARVKRVVYGADDARVGALPRLLQWMDVGKLNHVTEFQGGLLAEECSGMLKGFFRDRRISQT